MSDETYSVSLPGGRVFGPFTLDDVLHAIRAGRIPPEATVSRGRVVCSAGQFLARHDPDHPADSGDTRVGRMDSQVRARLGSTLAATPRAIANFRQKAEGR